MKDGSLFLCVTSLSTGAFLGAPLELSLCLGWVLTHLDNLSCCCKSKDMSKSVKVVCPVRDGKSGGGWWIVIGIAVSCVIVVF